MKNSLKINYIVCILISLTFGCKDDEMKPEDHWIMNDIPFAPLTENFGVGTYYYYQNSAFWNENIVEIPALGKYSTDETTISQHVTYTKTAGIDFFIVPFNSGFNDQDNNAANINYIDTAVVRLDSIYYDFLWSNTNANDIKFAFIYDHSSFDFDAKQREADTSATIYGDTVELLPLVLRDFERMVDYMKTDNYYKHDGNPVLVINNIPSLRCIDYGYVYDEIRNVFTNEGITIYLVGRQNEWTPPARYDLRLNGNVDAMTHGNFKFTELHDRWFFNLNLTYENWNYSAGFWAENWEADFIPNVVPSYDHHITEPGNDRIFTFEKNPDEFSALCNIARYTSRETRLIFISSFNNWIYNTQIEPAESYGNQYLDIINNEFKIGN